MIPSLDNPFASIEDAKEYLTLLTQTVFETKLEIAADLESESDGISPRRTDALKLALYTLTRLEFHMGRSQRILNDLRTLRRLLFEERTLTAMTERPQIDGKARAETLYSTAKYRSLHPLNRPAASA
ncbi:MAG TPA: hypothetical protein VMD98_10310 [Bryocella sp.]|nr:hypothetical protein [Bryocella sp.]